MAVCAALGAFEHPACGLAIERICGNVTGRIKSFQTRDPEQGVLFVGSKGWMFVGRERAAEREIPPTRKRDSHPPAGVTSNAAARGSSSSAGR
jgi:hypothetical protein